jgi:hypothetical protein
MLTRWNFSAIVKEPFFFGGGYFGKWFGDKVVVGTNNEEGKDMNWKVIHENRRRKGNSEWKET